MPPGRQFPLAGSFHQSFLRLLQIVALFLMSDTRMQNGPFCDTYCTFAWTRDTLFFLYDVAILACRFRRTFGILILVFLLFLWGSGSISLLSTICISGFLVTKCLDVFCLLVSVGCCCPIFLWYYETLPLFLCGKKMSLSLLSGKYLNFLASLARLNNGLPRVKSKSLITCVICSRVVFIGTVWSSSAKNLKQIWKVMSQSQHQTRALQATFCR